jgi:hypothetical protein
MGQANALGARDELNSFMGDLNVADTAYSPEIIRKVVI